MLWCDESLPKSAEILRNLKIFLEPRNQEPRLHRSLGQNLGSDEKVFLEPRTKIIPKTSEQSCFLVSWFQGILKTS